MEGGSECRVCVTAACTHVPTSAPFFLTAGIKIQGEKSRVKNKGQAGKGAENSRMMNDE